MNARRFARYLLDLGAAFDGAVRAAGAVDVGRRPPRSALRQLGISETAFDDVRLG